MTTQLTDSNDDMVSILSNRKVISKSGIIFAEVAAGAAVIAEDEAEEDEAEEDRRRFTSFPVVGETYFKERLNG